MNNPIESKPLFAVGEVVILQSVSYSQYNGEHTVEAVIEDGEKYRGFACGNGDGERGYDLGFTVSGERFTIFRESVIRKRHQPGEHSFEDLKTILYLPQSRDEIARLERGMQV